MPARPSRHRVLLDALPPALALLLAYAPAAPAQTPPGTQHSPPTLQGTPSEPVSVPPSSPPPAPASTAETEATATARLPSVEVIGSSPPATYHAGEAAGAKTELPLRELPQSVRIITRQTVDDLGATRLDDVLDYVGGVSRQNGFGGLWDNPAIRGLPGNENTGMAMLLNGFSANRGFNAPRDAAGVERIEFLKGPAAALYGSSEPGGTLNVVTKRPSWSPAHSVDLRTGSDGFKRAAVDSGGPLGERFAYRLNAAVEDRDGFRDHAGTRRQFIAPAFSWKPGADTIVEYSGEYLRHATPLDRGVVAVGNRLGAIPRSRFLGEPADGDVTVHNQTHQLVVAHEWHRDWRSRIGLSYRRTALEGFSTEATALQADGLLTRQRRFRDYQSDDVALQAELQGKVRHGAFEHELLFGIERFRFRMDSLMLRVNPSAAAPYAIDIHRPVYGQPQPVPLPNTDTLETQRGTGLYLQDAVKLAADWRLLAGLRIDRYGDRLQNRRTGLTTNQDPSAVSPRLGLSWLATPQWTLYANAGRSFRPNVGSDAAARAFDPESGRSAELGVKWQSADQALGASAALFDIRKRNVLTADPSNAGFSLAAGAVRSRGLELDLAGRLTRHWRINASLTFNDVQITQDNTLEVGGRLLNVPRVTGGVLAMYEDRLADGRRFGVGGGLVHVGKRLGQARTQVEAATGAARFELPRYTTLRLSSHWQLSPKLRLTLDIDNLFDSEHYTSSYSRVWVMPGAPRTIMLGLQARL